ncbi:hypothetical protein [Acetobacter senegalensis]|uniref:hypothetical protein n=1 Tax=Acetobacter senegalensis TaxID=446692 RepID=UPI00073F2771|nr:hypothetical protein [Acetobacter senegalensis]MCG4274155.1 hypothetical protein [Acetobacter senegalensis]
MANLLGFSVYMASPQTFSLPLQAQKDPTEAFNGRLHAPPLKSLQVCQNMLTDFIKTEIL